LIYVGVARVYFKSKKSLYKRKQSGKQEANAAMQHNVRRSKGLKVTYIVNFAESSCSFKGVKSVKDP